MLATASGAPIAVLADERPLEVAGGAVEVTGEHGEVAEGALHRAREAGADAVDEVEVGVRRELGVDERGRLATEVALQRVPR